MDIIQTLTLQDENGNARILSCGLITSKEMQKQMFEQRLRIYNKYKYFDPAQAGALSEDTDAHDTPSIATYVGISLDGRLLGSMRLLHTSPLPLFKTFTFNTPEQFNSAKKMGELSRLVVERTKEDSFIPRNVLMLFLADVALTYAQKEGFDVGCAYIKSKLIGKLRLLRMPFTSLQDFSCAYPKDGMMAPYFYNQPDDVPVPCFFHVTDIATFLHEVLRNTSLFEQSGTNYTLRNTLYRKFLSTLGVL